MPTEAPRRGRLAALRGIRGRVVASHVLLIAAALTATLLFVRIVLYARAEDRIEQALVQEVEELRRYAAGRNPDTGEVFGRDTASIFDAFLASTVLGEDESVLTIVDGRPYAETLGAPHKLSERTAMVRRWSQLREPLRLDIGSGVDEARTLAVPLLDEDGEAPGVAVMAVFPHAQFAEIDRAVQTIALVGLGVLVVAAVAAFALGQRLLRPVESLRDTARRVSDNDLSVRFDATGSDEIAELGSAFDDMLDRLESGFEAQRHVLDDVAHELRTPITIVRGHLELLDEDDPASRAETVELCIDELDRMGRYVNELLVVASADRPDFLDLDLVDVGEFADGLFSRVQALGEREWTLVCDIVPMSVLIEADPDRLTQAVVNLASNAVQHTSDGDRIELEISAVDDTLRLAVVDHGPGVSPDVRDSLFHRFSRGSGSRSIRPEGTGLGLTIVAAVADAHGGTATVEDTPGGGATFIVSLPLHNILDEPTQWEDQL